MFGDAVFGVACEINSFVGVVLQIVELGVALGVVVVLPAMGPNHLGVGVFDAFDALAFGVIEVEVAGGNDFGDNVLDEDGVAGFVIAVGFADERNKAMAVVVVGFGKERDLATSRMGWKRRSPAAIMPPQRTIFSGLKMLMRLEIPMPSQVAVSSMTLLAKASPAVAASETIFPVRVDRSPLQASVSVDVAPASRPSRAVQVSPVTEP